jgi:hypothetical protein
MTTESQPEISNILPDGPMLIEGTEVPLSTDQPVMPTVHRPKLEPQKEVLFSMPAETSSQERPKTIPVRGRLAERADTNGVKREVETELQSTPLPDVGEADRERIAKEARERFEQMAAEQRARRLDEAQR